MDKNTLLSKLQSYENTAKGKKRKAVDTDVLFTTLTDEEILLVLAHRTKKLRIQNSLKQTTFSKNTELSSPTTYSNFEQTGKVSLLNFIKIVRTFGRSSELNDLLRGTLSSKIDGFNKVDKDKKRVRGSVK